MGIQAVPAQSPCNGEPDKKGKDTPQISERVWKVWTVAKKWGPEINFGHIHSRSNGGLKSPEDYIRILSMVDESVDMETFYLHFSGVKFENGDEKHYVPIKRGTASFEGLATAIVEMDLDVTIISDSPLLEHDARYMESVFEKVLKSMRKDEASPEKLVLPLAKKAQ